MARSFPACSALIGAALIGAACGPSEERAARVVADVSGSDAKAALVQNGSSVIAYICGGDNTVRTYTRWFEGPIDGEGAFNLEKDTWTLRGAFNESGAIAVLTSTSGVNADLVAPIVIGGEGLFEGSRTGRCKTGAITFGAPLAVQGAGCDSMGVVQQVTPDGPIDSAGFNVRIGDRSEMVAPVSL